ncbi:MAG: alkaline phosphatase family protein [Rhodospirillales bacterium]|nr:alkaline phosphatase family protein [Rhodospirillales bacterium]
MARVCGPIVGFRGQDGDRWRLRIMVAHRGGDVPGLLTADDGSIAPAQVGEVAGVRFFSWDLSIAQQDEQRSVAYSIAGDDASRGFTIPGRMQNPRIAYASCNGFSEPGNMRRTEDKNVSWKSLANEQARLPFHLLLLGGDQIYADQLWAEIPALRRFNGRPRAERLTTRAGPGLVRALETFYVETYCRRFTPEPIAAALASIPTLMMWDDHDIFDGWGSYSEEEQACDVFQAVFAAARSCFSLFQLQNDPDAPTWPALPGQGGFNTLLRIGEIGLLVLDLRSERTLHQVLAPSTWDVVFAALDGTHGLRHLLVMSSIPVVHPDLSFAGQTLDLLPGEQDLEDDLHDQWSSYDHRTERLRLLHRLLDFAEREGTRVTILSGDVHVAGLGVVQSTRRPVRWLNANVINQLTCSPVVHPPPPRIVRWLLERLGGEVSELDRGITAQMLQFPGTNYRFIANRNWLSLDIEIGEQGRIWANWFIEDRAQPLTKVVHACEYVTTSA